MPAASSEALSWLALRMRATVVSQILEGCDIRDSVENGSLTCFSKLRRELGEMHPKKRHLSGTFRMWGYDDV